MADADRFDVIVIGAGPAGETVASRLAPIGLRVALVEQELVGGECAYWACIPSKTLLRPGVVRSEAERAPGTSAPPPSRFEEVVAYRDYMVRDLDDHEEVESYGRQGVRVVKGQAAFRSPHEVEVGGLVLQSERIVIATGSEPVIPPIDGLDQCGYWTNREATTLTEVPASAIVLGGGPVGIELAQMLRRFGAEVQLVEAGDRLLAREDERVSELLLDALREDGIQVHLGEEASAANRSGEARSVRVGEQELSASELIVAIGRKPRVDELRLGNAGIEATKGGIPVDHRCRAAEGIWAVGDVTGEAAFTHVAMYQGRIVVADIRGEPASADYVAIPRVVFSDPEVAAVGMTRSQARDAGIELATPHIKLSESITRPSTYETEPRGELQLFVDRGRGVLVGAWAVGPLASEWIHYAALSIKAQIPVAVLKDTVAQFPTYVEAYLKALETLEG
jgi:pyruvate/2-oxoglutarate dehydrogenase complex dihydrolipoamide dehydrogenase (E3) component